jgi:LPPG:FO 2-phospho-L-lactate transferase
MKVAVLSGGVGGARFVRGLVDVTDPASLTVVVNVGDDLEVLGLHVSPDLDSVVYALAGVNDQVRGWGRADETWNALDTVADLDGESWFRLGDRDLGLHLVRTQALAHGMPLSAVTVRIRTALGIPAELLPATDDRLRTWIATPAGEFPSKRSTRRTCCFSRRATRTSRSRRSSPCLRSAPRSSAAACRASPCRR